MKVALYARVSSEKQAEKDLSIPAQLKALREYVSKHGWQVAHEFVDEAESARTADRPKFQEMISAARRKQRPFEAILVWKLSRFARNREDSIIYKSLLRKRGVQVISINEPVDESPAGKMLEGMIEVVDEFYSNNLSQDTIRGMRENARRGYLNGGYRAFGYRTIRVQDGNAERVKLAIHETEASIVKRIFQMCLQGMGAKEIVYALSREGLTTRLGKRWGKSAVYYVLTNETYTGLLVFGKFRDKSKQGNPSSPEEIVQVENAFPAIVDKETFQKVQRLLAERAPKVTSPRALGSNHLLSRLVACGKCGRGMTACSAKSGQHHYYACNNYLKRGKEVCNAKLIPTKKLEAFVVERLKQNILTEANLLELVQMVNEEITVSKDEVQGKTRDLENQLRERRARLDRLYDALETEKLTMQELGPRIREHLLQIEELEKRKEETESQLFQEEIQATSWEVGRYVESLHDLLDHASLWERKSCLRSFIKRVEVNLPTISVSYTFPIVETPYPSNKEVLSFVQDGSPARTRTWDMLVNSEPLYQLSYRGMMLLRNARPWPDFKNRSRRWAETLSGNCS